MQEEELIGAHDLVKWEGMVQIVMYGKGIFLFCILILLSNEMKY